MKWRVKTILGFYRFLLPLLPLLMLIRNLNRNLLLILLLLPCCPKWMTRQRTKFPAPSLAPLPFSPHGAKAPPPATKQPPKPPTGGDSTCWGVTDPLTCPLVRSPTHSLAHRMNEWLTDWLSYPQGSSSVTQTRISFHFHFIHFARCPKQPCLVFPFAASFCFSVVSVGCSKFFSFRFLLAWFLYPVLIEQTGILHCIDIRGMAFLTLKVS